MAIETLDHCAIRSNDLEGTEDFLVDVIGVTVGERPPVDFPGYRLYSGDTAIVPLFGGSADGTDRDELSKYLGAKNPNGVAMELNYPALEATATTRAAAE